METLTTKFYAKLTPDTFSRLTFIKPLDMKYSLYYQLLLRIKVKIKINNIK